MTKKPRPGDMVKYERVPVCEPPSIAIVVSCTGVPAQLVRMITLLVNGTMCYYVIDALNEKYWADMTIDPSLPSGKS